MGKDTLFSLRDRSAATFCFHLMHLKHFDTPARFRLRSRGAWKGIIEEADGFESLS
jgi:hypothetical protein